MQRLFKIANRAGILREGIVSATHCSSFQGFAQPVPDLAQPIGDVYYRIYTYMSSNLRTRPIRAFGY